METRSSVLVRCRSMHWKHFTCCSKRKINMELVMMKWCMDPYCWLGTVIWKTTSNLYTSKGSCTCLLQTGFRHCTQVVCIWQNPTLRQTCSWENQRAPFAFNNSNNSVFVTLLLLCQPRYATLQWTLKGQKDRLNGEFPTLTPFCEEKSVLKQLILITIFAFRWGLHVNPAAL